METEKQRNEKQRNEKVGSIALFCIIRYIVLPVPGRVFIADSCFQQFLIDAFAVIAVALYSLSVFCS